MWVVVVQTLSHVWLCDPMNCSMPGFPVLHHHLEFAQTHDHWVSDAIQTSHPLGPFSSCPQSFPASGSLPMNRFFSSNGQSIGASASTSVLPMNIQSWFSSGLTGLISLLSKGLSRVFGLYTYLTDLLFPTNSKLTKQPISMPISLPPSLLLSSSHNKTKIKAPQINLPKIPRHLFFQKRKKKSILRQEMIIEWF